MPKCLTIISHWSFFENFKQFLKYIYQASLTPSPLPLERFICNFVDEIPLPPPGRANVVYKLEQQEFTLHRLPPNKIQVVDIDPRVLYLQLSHDVVVRVFSLLLLEQKVLMLSSRFSSLSDVGDALLSYLQPLTWEHVYIPILPARLFEFVNAPTPFLMGCHVQVCARARVCVCVARARARVPLPPPPPPHISPHSLCLQVLDDLQVPDDVALLFIDENRLELGGGRGHFATIPYLPDKRHKKLLLRLSEAKAPTPSQSSGFIQLMEMAFPMAAPPSSDVDDGDRGADQGGEEVSSSNRAKIQDCFYQCLVSLLVRYNEFTIPLPPAAPEKVESSGRFGSLSVAPASMRPTSVSDDFRCV